MTVDTSYGSFPDEFAKYVRPTRLADYDYGFLRKQANDLVAEASTLYQALTEIHAYVAGLPERLTCEDIPASAIWKNGAASANTRTTLFIALARAAGIPARVHGWKLHREAFAERWVKPLLLVAPRQILFTFPEVYYNKRWMSLSEALKSAAAPDWSAEPFLDAASRTQPIPSGWVSVDLGSFWHPDTFFATHGTNLDGWRKPFLPLARPLLSRRPKPKRRKDGGKTDQRDTGSAAKEAGSASAKGKDSSSAKGKGASAPAPKRKSSKKSKSPKKRKGSGGSKKKSRKPSAKSSKKSSKRTARSTGKSKKSSRSGRKKGKKKK